MRATRTYFLFIAAIFFGAGCATSGPRLSEAIAPTPFKRLTVAIPADEAKARYDNHKIYINDYGVQVGRRHFDAERLPDYMEASGALKVAADMDALLLKAGNLARSARIKSSFAGLPGGEFVKASADEDLARKEDIVARYPRVAADFNGRLAYALGLSLGPVDLSAQKSAPAPLSSVSVTETDNATLRDWVADYQLLAIRGKWHLGYRSLEADEVGSELSRIGSSEGESFATGHSIHNAGRWVSAAGQVVMALGLASILFVRDVTIPIYMLAGGAVVWGVSLPLSIGGNAKMGSAQAEYNGSLEPRLRDRIGKAESGPPPLGPP